MKKIIYNIKEHLVAYDILFLLIFILVTLILRLFSIRFRLWLSLTIISIFFLVLLFKLINFIVKRKSPILAILITTTSVIIISSIFVVTIFSSKNITILLKDLVPSIFTEEHLITLDNKKYILIEVDDKKFYYDAYGIFFMGNDLKILGISEDKKNDNKFVFTYFNDLGQVSKKEKVMYDKDSFGNIISENHESMFPIEEEGINPDDYLLAEDEEVLYEKQFSNTVLRFTLGDYALGQNYLVHVIVSENGGKSFRRIKGELVQVSQKPRFTFVDELNGFAIKNGLIRISDSYGMKVTNDGELTFAFSEFKYNNNEIEYLNIIDVPYLENNILKLKCSITVFNEKIGGYEKKPITFVSFDKGLTWIEEKD